jgi:hypothetical protein
MRITAPDVINSLTLNDAITGEQPTFYYRIPTTEERAQYNRQLWKRDRNKVKSAIEETRQHFGKKILTGFKEGDFGKIVEGQPVPYSSDPKLSHYDPNWKDLLGQYAADLIAFLAATVFEGTSRAIDILPEGDDEKEEAAEEIDPNA